MLKNVFFELAAYELIKKKSDPRNRKRGFLSKKKLCSEAEQETHDADALVVLFPEIECQKLCRRQYLVDAQFATFGDVPLRSVLPMQLSYLRGHRGTARCKNGKICAFSQKRCLIGTPDWNAVQSSIEPFHPTPLQPAFLELCLIILDCSTCS